MMKNIFIYAAMAITLSAFTLQAPRQIFLLGDSISLQYMPYLQNYLSGQYVVDNKQDNGESLKNLDIPRGSNGGDSHMVLEYLKIRLKESSFKPHVLLLNCGLHDIKRNPKTQQFAITAEQYRGNLNEIFNLIKQRKIFLMWIRSTEVVDSIHAKNKEFNRFAVDLQRYNAIADEVAARHHVPEIDLYSFTRRLGAGRFADHVHYTDEVKALQAAYIAGFIQQYNSKN